MIAEPDKNAPLVQAEVTGINVSINVPELKNMDGVLNNAIAAIERGVGRIAAPMLRILDARADREVARQRALTVAQQVKLAADLKKILSENGITSESLEGRAIQRLLIDGVHTQNNREGIADALWEEIQQTPPAKDTDDIIDDDWLTQYWELAGRISNVGLQRMLARLLKSEVSSPGAVSPVTLHAMAMLTPRVSEIFLRLCNLTIRHSGGVIVVQPKPAAFQEIASLETYGLSLSELNELESVGLIRSTTLLMLNYSEENALEPVDYAGGPARLNFAKLQIKQLQLTRAGAELRELRPMHRVRAYTDALKAHLGAAFELGA